MFAAALAAEDAADGGSSNAQQPLLAAEQGSGGEPGQGQGQEQQGQEPHLGWAALLQPRYRRVMILAAALPVGAALAAAAAAGGRPSPAAAVAAAAAATAPGLGRWRRGGVGGAGVSPRFFLSIHILHFIEVMVTMLACQMKAPM
jgi:hypothetical protein